MWFVLVLWVCLYMVLISVWLVFCLCVLGVVYRFCR